MTFTRPVDQLPAVMERPSPKSIEEKTRWSMGTIKQHATNLRVGVKFDPLDEVVVIVTRQVITQEDIQDLLNGGYSRELPQNIKLGGHDHIPSCVGPMMAPFSLETKRTLSGIQHRFLLRPNQPLVTRTEDGNLDIGFPKPIQQDMEFAIFLRKANDQKVD